MIHILIIGIGLLFAVGAIYLYLVAPAAGSRRKLTPYMGVMWAHRGLHDAAAGVPENSMEAFRLAVEEHVGIELDVHLSKDGELLVFHDDDLCRMCGVTGRIETLSADEVTKLRLLDTQWHIPRLSEVLALVDGQVPLLIEIKLMSADTTICRKLMEELADYRGPYLIQSFNCLALWWMRRHAGSVPRGQLSENLTRRSPYPHYALRFVVKHLLGNVLARPDFISYRIQDWRTPGLFLARHLFRAPVAVWTLKGKGQMEKARKRFQMFIFEK